MTANIVNLKVLTPPSFSSLLAKLSLRAPLPPSATAAKKTKETKVTEWGRYYTVLQCSAKYMDKFADYEADQVNVVVDPVDNKIIVNVVSVDGKVSLYNLMTAFPCSICKSAVTDNEDDSGRGLQCTTCTLFYHNSCAPAKYKASPALIKALNGSPDNICVYCPQCMVDDNPVTIAGIASSLNEVVAEVKKKPLMSQVANSNLPSQLPKGLEINMKKSNQLLETLAKQNSSTKAAEEKDKKDRTRLVRKPKVVSNSRELMKSFNKDYPGLGVREIRTTAAGSILLELEDKTTAEELDVMWRVDDKGAGTSFGGNEELVKLDRELNAGIVKHVYDKSVGEIQEEVLRVFPETVTEVFTRKVWNKGKQEEVQTGTIKIKFKDRKQLEEAIASKVFFFSQRHIVDEFKWRPKAIKCHRCQRFGHVAHNCRSKSVKCGYCSSDKHESRECKVESSAYKCAHCSGKHPTGSSGCSVLVAKEEEIRNRYHYG